jgi:hypothetical protein
VVPFGEVWIWKARPYAPSHCRTTRQIEAVAPRSTCSHCGSLNWLDQRVVALPSTALAAATSAFSAEEAVAALPWAAFVVPQTPGSGVEPVEP